MIGDPPSLGKDPKMTGRRKRKRKEKEEEKEKGAGLVKKRNQHPRSQCCEKDDKREDMIVERCAAACFLDN